MKIRGFLLNMYVCVCLSDDFSNFHVKYNLFHSTDSVM